MNTAQLDRLLHAPGRFPRQRRGARQAARVVPAHRAAAGARLPDDARRAGRAVRRADRSGPGGVASRSARRTSSGTARASRTSCAGEQIGLPARLVQLAGPVEVFSPAARARRRRVAMARRHRGTQFDPASGRTCSARTRPRCSTGWTRPRAGTPCSTSSRSSSRRVGGADLDGVLEAMADLADLKSPVPRRPLAGGGQPGRRGGAGVGLPAEDAHAVRRAGLIHDLGRVGVSNAIWDKPSRLTRRRAGARPTAPVPDRPHAGPGGGARRRSRDDRRTPPRAPRRLGLPAGAHGGVAHPVRPAAGRGRRLSRDDRASAAPPALDADRRPRASCGPRCAPAGWTATPWTPCSRLRATAPRPAGRGPRASPRARSRSSASWPGARRTSRSRSTSSSRRRPCRTTSSTSTRRSASPAVRRPRCTPTQQGLLGSYEPGGLPGELERSQKMG